jgi:SAM-dependent methyltransferase
VDVRPVGESSAQLHLRTFPAVSMSAQVLRFKWEIDRARLELNRRGLSSTSSWWENTLRYLGVGNRIKVGDHLKSWDVLKTAGFLEERVSRDAPILDIGALASELVCVLHRMGFTNLFGVDLDPHVRLMPFARAIHYKVANFMRTSFENESFEAVTAVSVIEHGFRSKALLSEVSRLLCPGGYFVASFDYWPQKVDTTGVLLFGMDWRIFSQEEVLQFIEEARAYGLVTVGEVDLHAQEAPIAYAERDYTFAWLALRKGTGGLQ